MADMDEKINGDEAQLKDPDLEQVSGGTYVGPSPTGKYYKMVGGSDPSWAYRCPHCSSPMWHSNWGYFKCDNCGNKYWVGESELWRYADLSSGRWQEVSKEEYDDANARNAMIGASRSV
jgi:DNA-directed RNA polymerase subunit RPC12/RpoP